MTRARLLLAAIVDTMLLLYYILDMGIVGTFIRTQKDMAEPYWYCVSFPYVLHPYKGIFLTASIFMVVAISAERHRAICSPLTHRPTFWPYVVLVFCISGEDSIHIRAVAVRTTLAAGSSGVGIKS